MSDTLDPKSPSMKLWRTLITQGVDTDEATELMNGYAHELAERARRGVGVLEDHVGGFQYSRDVREILDVVDPTTPDPDGWDF